MENQSKWLGESFDRHQNPNPNLRLHPRKSYFFQALRFLVWPKILEMLQVPQLLAHLCNQKEVQSQATQIKWKEEARFLMDREEQRILDHGRLPSATHALLVSSFPLLFWEFCFCSLWYFLPFCSGGFSLQWRCRWKLEYFGSCRGYCRQRLLDFFLPENCINLNEWKKKCLKFFPLLTHLNENKL